MKGQARRHQQRHVAADPRRKNDENIADRDELFYAPNAATTEQAVLDGDNVSLPPLESVTDNDLLTVLFNPNDGHGDDGAIHHSNAAASSSGGFLPRRAVVENSIKEHRAKMEEHRDARMNLIKQLA